MKIVPLGQFGSNIFFAQPFLSLVVFNSITDAAFITWFLKRWFCKSRQFLDITQSKYVITWRQCLKFVQILILGSAIQKKCRCVHHWQIFAHFKISIVSASTSHHENQSEEKAYTQIFVFCLIFTQNIIVKCEKREKLNKSIFGTPNNDCVVVSCSPFPFHKFYIPRSALTNDISKLENQSFESVRDKRTYKLDPRLRIKR